MPNAQRPRSFADQITVRYNNTAIFQGGPGSRGRLFHGPPFVFSYTRKFGAAFSGEGTNTIMITADKISKSFGPQTVLKDVTLLLRPKDRIGVVGMNGAGKSTLIKILAGIEETDKGAVVTHGSSVGYLSQESQCRLGVTVGEEMRDALPGIADLEERLHRASEAVASDDAGKSDLAALSKAADDLQRLDAHTVDARIGRVLSGLGFELDATERLTDTYSGGWQMRIAMAKLLLQEPDYLFLDEPTNHLDTTAKYWLMYDYIPSYPGTIVAISHEPEFLNIISERIWEVEDAGVKEYTGNYDDYVRLKDEEYDRQVKAYESQQKEIADWKEFVQRWKGNKSKAGMVEDREKKLAKLNILSRPESPPALHVPANAGTAARPRRTGYYSRCRQEVRQQNHLGLRDDGGHSGR